MEEDGDVISSGSGRDERKKVSVSERRDEGGKDRRDSAVQFWSGRELTEVHSIPHQVFNQSLTSSDHPGDGSWVNGKRRLVLPFVRLQQRSRFNGHGVGHSERL